ncbi:MAG: cyclic dehypoxanthinyl futalosine synthase [Thermodesulforhabdaceae bacterium]
MENLIDDIVKKIESGERLNRDDGIRLFCHANLLTLGTLAHKVKTDLHDDQVFYVVNRHINYSNVCLNGCRFCAFGKPPGHPGAFEFTIDEIRRKLEEETSPVVKEIHIVGGCHPYFPMTYYEDILRVARSLRPQAVIKAFTAVEIDHIAKLENASVEEILDRFRKAGLDMMPGGGAEIFADRVRRQICPNKISGDRWLEVHRLAHKRGIKTNATMLFGHIESIEDRVDHILDIRKLQDETGGFTCFILLPYQSKLSPLKTVSSPTGVDILRTIAVSRLLLDNVPHIKAYWIMLTVKLAQLALYFGADDLDGTVVEEKIAHMAGAESEECLTREELEEIIRSAGLDPVERDGLFRHLHNNKGRKFFESCSKNRVAEETTLPKNCRPWVSKSNGSLEDIIHRVEKGERIFSDEALVLYNKADLFTLGRLAHNIRLNKHPHPYVTYVVDRNINYTNVCASGCKFCAFYRSSEDPDAYVITKEELYRKIEETLSLGGTQILLQGGHNPNLSLSFYEDMLSFIKTSFPKIHIHAFSPPEIVFFANKERLSISEVISRLKASGLNSIPGGGAEILVDEVRRVVSPRKCTAEEWLAVMEEAHRQGLRTTATMMFGHVERPEHRIEHLIKLRELQDKTRGFTAFIPWTFQPRNTALEGKTKQAMSIDYLRLLAISRIILDNFDNLQASWVTMGPHVAQAALFFGANDFGSTMIEENVVAAAGVRFRMSLEEMHRIIREAGFVPKQRTMAYEWID